MSAMRQAAQQRNPGTRGIGQKWISAACMLAVLTAVSSLAADSNFHVIDLSPVGGSSNELSFLRGSSFPRGLQSFGGIPFNVETKLAVTGMDDARNGEYYPSR